MACAQFCTGSDVVKVADKGCRGNIFIGVEWVGYEVIRDIIKAK